MDEYIESSLILASSHSEKMAAKNVRSVFGVFSSLTRVLLDLKNYEEKKFTKVGAAVKVLARG